MVETNEIACDLCRSKDSEHLFDAIDRLHGFEGRFKYVRCNSCSLVYMNPQISTSEIGKYYPDDYAPHKVKIRNNPKIGIFAKFRNFRKELLGTVKMLPFVKNKMGPNTKLLDVGCGGGKFLAKIRQETGCKVEGLDISKQAIKYANENYGIDVFCGNITEAPFADESFDIITAWWYLEHVPNPSEVVHMMHRLLKTDGRCIIGVPNIESFNGKFFKDKWYHLDCPRHLFLYSPKTISEFLTKAGFDIEKMVFDKTAWGLFHSCRYFFDKKNVPLRNRKHLPGSSIIKRLMLPFTLFLSLIKKSDTVVVYAVKREC